MALLKKCNHCSEKGIFLKLTNGLCDNCKSAIENLETNYTNLLQKIALNPNNKFIFIEELNTLITKAIPFDGTASISISTYKKLLSTLSENELTKNESTVKPNEALPNNETQDTNKLPPIESKFTNIDSSVGDKTNVSNSNNIKLQISNLDINSKSNLNIKPNSIFKNTSHTTKENQHKPIQNVLVTETIPNSAPCVPIKIKNLVEPVPTPKTLTDYENNPAEKKTPTNLTLNLSNKPSLKQTSTLNLNLQSTLNKKEIKNKIESTLKTSIEPSSIKDTFILNNLKKGCSTLIAKLDDSNASLDSIAEGYFDIKNNLLPSLNKSIETDIQTTLDTVKNTLCIRSKKSETELFDFFNYITIFIQTTGLAPTNSDIIEISALKISYGKIIDEFYTLVNPIKSIKLSVTKTTGISNEDVENKPTIDLVIPSLIKFIGDYQLVGFNAKPVELFINSTLKKLNMPLIPKTPLSTISLYRVRYKSFHGQPPTLSDITSTCIDLLPQNDIAYINNFKSFSISSSHAIFKIYEILKYRYK